MSHPSSSDDSTFRNCNVSKEGNEVSDSVTSNSMTTVRRTSQKRLDIVKQLISENKEIVLSLASSDEKEEPIGTGDISSSQTPTVPNEASNIDTEQSDTLKELDVLLLKA